MANPRRPTMLKAVPKPVAGYAGAITGLYGDVLQGWVLDTEKPDVRLAVEVFIDGAYVELARADQPQHTCQEGDGFHGFAVRLNQKWLQNATQIAVRIANHGPWLEGSIQLPGSAAAAEPGPASSQLLYAGGLKVGGWAWDPENDARHVKVIARDGSKILAQASADLPHSALVNRASPNHGFSLDLPWQLADGNTHTIHIETDQGQPLSGSPVKVFFHPEGLHTLLRQHWPASDSDSDSVLTLLSAIAQDQDRRAPRSVGFAHYAEWFKVFQQPGPLSSPSPTLKAGVLLYGTGSASDEAVSQASIQAQRWPAHAIVRAEPQRLPQAAHQLLSQGVDAIIPLHVGDHLPPHALDTLLPLLAGGDAADWAYADNDCDGPDGERTSPWLKPAWDINLFLGADIVTPGSAWSAPLVRQAMALPSHPPGGEIEDFAAAVAAAAQHHKAAVVHLPRVLYHRRHGAPASPAMCPANPQRQQAMQWLANMLAPGAQVSAHPAYPGLLRTEWPLPQALPRVSLIVPTRDQYKLLHTCVEGLLAQTDYPNLEIIVVDNDSTCPQTLAYLQELPRRGVIVLPHPYPFNYSTINNRAAEHASGSIIGLVNNDIEVREPGWLKAMVAQLLQPGTGAVGAKLLWPNGMVQHGGVVVGVNALASHTGNNWLASDAGYLGLNHLARRQSAVTAACLLLHKDLFHELGGLDESAFAVTFNDVDLCLRICQQGLAIVWTPLAQLVHAESASRGKDHSSEKQARAAREQQNFISRWTSTWPNDPYYHPALNHDWVSGPYTALDCAPGAYPRPCAT